MVTKKNFEPPSQRRRHYATTYHRPLPAPVRRIVMAGVDRLGSGRCSPGGVQRDRFDGRPAGGLGGPRSACGHYYHSLYTESVGFPHGCLVCDHMTRHH